MSCQDTYRMKALCLRDMIWDILKHHVKIQTREKLNACRMCDETFGNIMKINTGENPLPTGCVIRHSETSWEDTHKRKALCLQELQWDILKYRQRYTKEKSHFPEGCVTRLSEMSQEDKHRRKVYRMCDEKYWNVKWRDTQEKSLQDVRWDLCRSDGPETSRENVQRRKTICMWEVQWVLFLSDRPEMSGEDTHRRKALCLQDVWREILKCHVKIHTGEKLAGCAMRPLSVGPTRNVMRKCAQDKNHLHVGCATRPL